MDPQDGGLCQGERLWLWLALLLTSASVAVNDEGPMCSCQNNGACDFTNQDEFKFLGKSNFSHFECVYVSGCGVQGNVALGKLAKMSSLWNSSSFNEVSGPACLAVNGNRNTTFRQINRFPDSPNCIHTGEDDFSPYWEVDLGQPYLIASITIYWRHKFTYRSEGISVTVDGQLCHIFQSPVSNPSNITCGTPLTGQTVRLYKNDNRTTRHQYALHVCEVEVWDYGAVSISNLSKTPQEYTLSNRMRSTAEHHRRNKSWKKTLPPTRKTDEGLLTEFSRETFNLRQLKQLQNLEVVIGKHIKSASDARCST